MDDKVKKQTPEESIRPDFLKKSSSDDTGKSGKSKDGLAKDTLKNAEVGAAEMPKYGGFKNNVAGKELAKKQQLPNVNLGGNGKGSSKGKKMAVGSGILLIGLLLAAIPLALFGIPALVMATIDYKLNEELGFGDTTAIVEEQAEHIIAEQLASGDFYQSYAQDLAREGIVIGQVTAAGDFVETNTYIAELGSVREVAANDSYHDNSRGELAVKFENEIINADDFVAQVESNPKMYAAFAKATDMAARFYYSDEVKEVYKNFGLSRNNFARYQETGDKKKNNEQFEEIFSSAISKVAEVGLNGYSSENEGFSTKIAKSSDNNARDFVRSISDGVKGPDATKKVASLLNAAVSASEPYVAAATFVATLEATNRARIDGDGPVDPLMDMMSAANEVTVTNVATGEDHKTTNSIFNTRNFNAVVSGGNYSMEEAANYSRDRVIGMTGGSSANIINDTTMAAEKSRRFNILVPMFGGAAANYEELASSANSISTTFFSDPMVMTKSSIGGNRIIMGGSFLSDSINSWVLGAMGSDEKTLTHYKKEVDEVLARRAEAERMTLSPFDISSENTFLGSIVREFSALLTGGMSSNGTLGNSVVKSMAGLLNSSVTKVTAGLALAEGNNSYMMANGNCPVVESAAGVKGDIYCTAHTTMDTSRMGWTLEDYKKSGLASSINENGEIADKGELAEFVKLAMEREVTVGVESADVCERWKKLHQGGVERFMDLLSDIVGLYESCDNSLNDEAPGVSTGAAYMLSANNSNQEKIGLYSSYILYSTVSSLLSDKTNPVTAFRERYNLEHPRDESGAAVLARRSGITKTEAETALGYVEYLKFLAHYEPSERYAFVGLKIDVPEKPILIDDNQKLYLALGIVGEKFLYNDSRRLAMISA